MYHKVKENYQRCFNCNKLISNDTQLALSRINKSNGNSKRKIFCSYFCVNMYTYIIIKENKEID